jgi:hypothetical protein
MSDLSPQSGPKRTLMIQIVVTNRDFMSTRPRYPQSFPPRPRKALPHFFLGKTTRQVLFERFANNLSLRGSVIGSTKVSQIAFSGLA